ncbi:MAG: DNA polymerase III subunit gamma/tau [bacterium]|nr:DNA polymerase III subunit gamma/tau [bacterium]
MLYRKYRPQVFSQLVGQEHVVRTLEGALSSGRVGQAYLFTGPRGTGKTTIARIFAKALNCADFGKKGTILPCNTCEACLSVNNGTSLDLIEIDAASNRGIDEIRALKESAQVSAPSGGYKVFLIDEVHMLTKDSFNALLKILEEPPAHVVFILATTEPHKILATVLSRVQRFDFKRITPAEMVTKLKSIAQAEKIQIDDLALLAIAKSSDGALRDAEVALTKIRSMIPSGPIGEKEVADVLGLIPISYHPKLLGFLASGDKSSAVALIHTIHDAGMDLEHFTKEFISYARSALLSRINPTLSASIEGPEAHQQFSALNTIDNEKLIKIINTFTLARSQIKFSPIPQLPLELAVMSL